MNATLPLTLAALEKRIGTERDNGALIYIKRADENGMPLVANLDALFDRGLISFEDTGEMIVSSRLTQSEQAVLGVPAKMRRTPVHTQTEFLEYHRSNIFKP